MLVAALRQDHAASAPRHRPDGRPLAAAHDDADDRTEGGADRAVLNGRARAVRIRRVTRGIDLQCRAPGCSHGVKDAVERNGLAVAHAYRLEVDREVRVAVIA